MVTDGLEEEKKQEETGGEGRNVGVQEDHRLHRQRHNDGGRKGGVTQ